LLIPLNALRSVSAIMGFTIWSWAAFGVCLHAIGKRLRWSSGLNLLAVPKA
jgi:hypothetical protein